jgi:hypothetical protein
MASLGKIKLINTSSDLHVGYASVEGRFYIKDENIFEASRCSL